MRDNGTDEQLNLDFPVRSRDDSEDLAASNPFPVALGLNGAESSQSVFYSGGRPQCVVAGVWDDHAGAAEQESRRVSFQASRFLDADRMFMALVESRRSETPGSRKDCDRMHEPVEQNQKSGLRGRISLQLVVAVDQVMRFW
ncbi:hypothetical protein RBB50_003221 [Rhinocladiella similis]